MTCHGGPLPGHWERRTASNQRLLCSSLSSPLSTEELLSLRSSLSATSPEPHSSSGTPFACQVLPDHKMCIKKKTVPIHMDPGVCTSRHSTRSHTACTQRHTGCTHSHTQPSNAESPRTREKDGPKMYARTCHSMLTFMPASSLVYMGEQSVFTMTCSYCAQILKVGRP